jgi:hypothetical protein
MATTVNSKFSHVMQGNNQIDLNTDKIIFVVYPPRAGGNFLSGLLGLSNSAVFMHEALTKQQLKNTLRVADKMQYLRHHFSFISTTNIWRDMGFGNDEFYGTDEGACDVSAITKNTIIKAIEHDKYFFCIVHEMQYLSYIAEVWKNAKILMFHNCQQFIAQRPLTATYTTNVVDKRRNRVDYWSNIKSSHYPDNPPNNIKEFNALSDNIKQELTNMFNSEIIYMLDDCNDNLFDAKDEYKNWGIFGDDNVQLWNNSWFLDEEQLIVNIKHLYKVYGLERVDDMYLREYYKMWGELAVSEPK